MSTPRRLYGAALRAAFDQIRDELGATDQKRLEPLQQLFVVERCSVADCCRALFGRVDDGALSDLRGFRMRFNNLQATDQAWRALQWRNSGPDRDRYPLLPAEYFGTLPG